MTAKLRHAAGKTIGTLTLTAVFAPAVALLAATSFGVAFSGAYFQDTDTTPQKVAADAPANVLHLYSQGSDPQGRTGYAVKPAGSHLVATGTSTALSLSVGHRTAP